MKSIKFLIYFLVLSINAAYAINPVTVNKPDQLAIGKSIEYYIDTTNSLTAQDVKNKEFVAVTNDIMNLGNIPHSVWFRFGLQSETEKEVLLEIAAPLIESLEVYNYSTESPEQIFRGGFLEPFIIRSDSV